ncbi:MAG TPA: thioredoxin-disulfide reductase, partial [Firmicutes bacterium]|nr:thioredoxin-disulfide reductase [Bacillota bacterium]
MVYDLIIVGMGPAGVTAAIYAKRAGLSVLCFDSSMIGGYLNYIDRIDNYPGLYGISGPDFAFKLFDTMKELNIEYYNKKVTKIENDGEYKKVIAEDNEYKCKNVIIAIGRKMRKLGLDKEEELLGKGISRCALCDGNFFKDKDVCVVGGGNSALQEALYLANICNKVYVIHRRDNFRADKELINRLTNKDNIEIIYNANVKELLTNKDVLSGVRLDNKVEIDVSGLFIYIG